MIIGQIDGQDATPSDFHRYFSHNKWSPENRDYYNIENFFDSEGTWSPENNSIPQQGEPVTGYRVFTYMENEENRLGSPVAGYMSHMETMFGNPQRRDDVNVHPEGRGYYYFPDKGVALAFAEYLLRDVEDIDYSMDYNDQPLHVMVSRVEGTYVNKYVQDNGRGQYGERMDNMKTIDVPLIDINATKLNEAYKSTAKAYTEIIHNPDYATDAFDEEVTVVKGPRALSLRDEMRYHAAFERVETASQERFMEKHPGVLLAKLGSQLSTEGLSFGHYDISRYKDLFSSDRKKRNDAETLLYNDMKELKEMFPGRDIPTEPGWDRW